MRLAVTTPLALIVEADEVKHLRAEDATGAFGILPGHADFLTVLSASVVSWRGRDGSERHLAVRGGMLEVHGGDTITIATREAVLDDDLRELEARVVAAFRRDAELEQTARTDERKLYVAAITQICRLLRGEPTPGVFGAPQITPLGGLEHA